MDSANKVMAQLLFGIDGIKAPMETIEKWANETAVTAQQTFEKAGIGTGLTSAQATATQQMEATAAKNTIGHKMGEKAKRDFTKQLLEAENALLSLQTKAAQMGAYLPSNVQRSLEYVRSLQESGGELTKQEQKSLQNITKRATLQSLEVKNAAQNLSLERARSKEVGHVADAEGRVGLAQKMNSKFVAEEVSGLNKKLIQMQSTVKTKGIENQLTLLGAKNLGEELALRQQELALLVAQLELNGKLNISEMQRLNLLKGQISVLEKDIGAASVSATKAKEKAKTATVVDESRVRLNTVKAELAQERILYMQSRRAAFESKPTGMAGLMERRLSWLYAGGLVMGGLAGITETVSTIKDVEYGMTTIARVIEDTTFSFKGMRDELQALGVQYGNTWDQVSDIATRWAQAGYDMNETLELTKSSLLALNTAELNAEEATSGMIAIMSQWGLTAEELLPTIDKINKVAWAA